MACSRSRGQPFDSKRHNVVCQVAALTLSPCTNTMGGVSLEDRLASSDGPVAQPAKLSRPAMSTRNRRREFIGVVSKGCHCGPDPQSTLAAVPPPLPSPARGGNKAQDDNPLCEHA